MSRSHWVSIAAFVLSTSTSLSLGHAQTQDEIQGPPPHRASSEHFGFELRFGPYAPDVSNGAFDTAFRNDPGLLIGFEIDGYPVRIPYVGLLGAGVGFSWAGYSDGAFFTEDGNEMRADEDTTLDLFPLSALLVLKVDVLAREVGIPLVFTGKFGGDMIFWQTATGDSDKHSGYSPGLRWAAQVALELDILERQAARTLDEEWGINHTFIFFEYFGSTAGFTGDFLRVGNTGWTLGFGMTI